ncbi:hypothetical protein SCAR479_11691 [Seiridium cardinale]|uniref:Uncharacterized protein n=1 Tax=Seiridium cardinale TaxID=138064 RepID=A0ABR2XD19_9PEZI
MAVNTSRPERITPNLTLQTPLGPHSHGPGLVIVTQAGAPAGLNVDTQQAYAQEGYIVAHLRISPSYTDLRIRDELREATEALSFHDQCSDKSRYGIIVYTPSAYPSLIDAIDGNGEIRSVVFFGQSPKQCRKPHISVTTDENAKAVGIDQTGPLEFLRSQ